MFAWLARQLPAAITGITVTIIGCQAIITGIMAITAETTTTGTAAGAITGELRNKFRNLTV